MVVLNPRSGDAKNDDNPTMNQSIINNQVYLGRKRQFPHNNLFGTYDYLPKSEALKAAEHERR